MYKKLFLMALILITFIPLIVTAYDPAAMTKKWEYNQDSGSITQVAQDENGLLVCAGATNGNISCWDSTGVMKWRQTFDSSITKLVVSPNGARFVASTIGNFVYYGAAVDGTIYGAYDGYNSSGYDPALKAGNVTDVDISRDGAFWLIAIKDKILVMDSTNTTVGLHYLNQSREAEGFGTFNQAAIDPDKGFVVVTYEGSSTIQEFLLANTTVPTDWYQGYQFRIGHVINGSPSGIILNFTAFTIKVYNTTGMNGDDTVYVGNRTRPDFRDIRFVDRSNNQLLPFYMTLSGSYSALFNVSFDTISSGDTKNIYIYFGNESADTDVSNATLVANVKPVDPYYISNDTFEWDMEANHLWTFATVGPVATTGVLPSHTWPTSNTSNMRLYKAYASIAGCGVSYNCNGTYTSSMGVPAMPLSASTWGSLIWNITVDVHFDSLTQQDSGLGIEILVDNLQKFWLWNVGNPGTVPGATERYQGNVSFYANPAQIIKANSYLYNNPAGTGLSAGFTYDLDHYRFYAEPVGGFATHGVWGSVQTQNDMPLQSSVAVTDIPIVIDIPWNSPWLAVSTISNIYNIQVTSAGFGTLFSAAGAASTPFDIRISDAASYTVEARGLITDIYRYGMTKVGTFSAGNNIHSVSISTSDGLWAVAGSDDGRWYVFSKAGQSTWYLYWASGAGSIVNAVSVNAHGNFVGAGYVDGNLSYYSTTPVPTPTGGTTFYITVHVLKDDIPYTNINCTLYDGASTGTAWQFVNTGPTDTRGNFVFQAIPQNYYKAICAPEAASTIIYSTNTLVDYYIVIKTQMISGTVDYSAQYSSTTNTIDMRYVDGGLATSAVTFRIINTGNYTESYNQTFASNNVAQSWSVPAGGMDTTYKIDMVAVRSTGTLHNMWMARPTGTMSSNLPMDTNTSNVICVIFLMVLAGLFGRVHSARGGLIVVGFFAFFIYKGWMTVPWWAAAPIVVFAFLYALSKGAPQ